MAKKSYPKKVDEMPMKMPMKMPMGAPPGKRGGPPKGPAHQMPKGKR